MELIDNKAENSHNLQGSQLQIYQLMQSSDRSQTYSITNLLCQHLEGILKVYRFWETVMSILRIFSGGL